MCYSVQDSPHRLYIATRLRFMIDEFTRINVLYEQPLLQILCHNGVRLLEIKVEHVAHYLQFVDAC